VADSLSELARERGSESIIGSVSIDGDSWGEDRSSGWRAAIEKVPFAMHSMGDLLTPDAPHPPFLYIRGK